VSRVRTNMQIWLGGLVLAGASTVPVQADVLEVGSSGAVWVAGGPAQMAPADYTAAATEAAPSTAAKAPVTEVRDGAGPAQWQARVAQLSTKYDVSPRLIEALVWQESRWNQRAVSHAGARGLAQLMPGTARDLGVNPHDADSNLEGGVRYLRMQLDTFDGNVEHALAAYNAGPKRVMDAGGIPRIKETQGYVRAIIGRLNQELKP
jgi:soluble lytic murein transglycosylase-like protein